MKLAGWMVALTCTTAAADPMPIERAPTVRVKSLCLLVLERSTSTLLPARYADLVTNNPKGLACAERLARAM